MFRDGSVTVLTLVVEDLATALAFYGETLEAEELYSDDVSAVFRVGSILINVLDVRDAPGLISPVPVGSPDGSRVLITIEVDDVDGIAAELAARGVEILSGPLNRPWGPRVATFADPAGHLWELAHNE